MTSPKPRRRHRPVAVERAVLRRQDGRCGCGRCQEPLGNDIQFNHDPPLALRVFDAKTGLYTPDENDPDHLFAEIASHHREGTSHPRGPHTSIDSDQHAIGKARRIRAKNLGTVEKGVVRKSNWPKGRKMQGRPFQKRMP